MGFVDSGRRCHVQALKNWVEFVLPVQNSLVHMLPVQNSLVQLASGAFDTIIDRYLVSRNSMIDGLWHMLMLQVHLKVDSCVLQQKYIVASVFCLRSEERHPYGNSHSKEHTIRAASRPARPWYLTAINYCTHRQSLRFHRRW